MPCYSPLKGYRAKKPNASGRYSLVFNRSLGFSDLPVDVPCGQCIGCRLERSRQWAIRITHEASLYSNNCFVTLTFDPQHLPADGSLNVVTFQNFMKRLRKEFGEGIRFFHCGEYGETFGRPHYHACLMNFDFPDRVLWKEVNGFKLYTSDILSRIWGQGFCSVGDVTFESAAYVARYITKKVTGPLAASHYERIDLETGEIINLKPEYTTMSRRPGIGHAWFEKYRSDVFPGDFVVMNAKKIKPPKYYSNKFELFDENAFKRVRINRVLNSKKHVDNNTPDRLFVREEVQLARLQMLKRNCDKDN